MALSYSPIGKWDKRRSVKRHKFKVCHCSIGTPDLVRFHLERTRFIPTLN